MSLEFYYDNLSQPCRAVYILLKVAGVDFKSNDVDLLKGEQNNPEFVKKNPFKKLPTIDDGGFVLAESAAIMQYVLNKYKLPEHWYPKTDIQKQARVDEFLHWQHLCLRKPAIDLIRGLFIERVGFGERIPKKPMDPEAKKKAREDFAKAVQHVDEYFLQDKSFIAGDEISIADLIGVHEVIQLLMVQQEDLYISNARVTAWIQRVKDRTQPYYDEACVKMDPFRQKFMAGGQTK